jgi:hypothetical protein
MVKQSASITQVAFEKMNKTEKVCHLFKTGEELLCRREREFLIRLYAISDFFVEVWYRSPGNKIDRIEVVSQLQVTKKYEKEIEIEDLL